MSVTVLLIIVNVVIFLLGASVFPKIVEVGILQPYRTVREKTWYELLTSCRFWASVSEYVRFIFLWPGHRAVTRKDTFFHSLLLGSYCFGGPFAYSA